MTDQKSNRRTFVGSLAALAVVRPLGAQRSEPSEEWLRGLRGKHRQFFDVGSMQNGSPLRRIANFMDTYVAAYGLRPRDVNAVFGAHGGALPLLFSDGLWADLGIGARANVIDSATGRIAERNVFRDGLGAPIKTEYSIAKLAERGVVFLACNNSIASLAGELATTTRPAAAIRSAIVGGLLPGVTVVPAMLIAGNRAQEAGLTYAAL